MAKRRIAKRQFKGQRPEKGEWKILGTFTHDKKDWIVWAQEPNNDYMTLHGYQTIKVQVDGEHPRKANYWMRWKHKKNALSASKDIDIMIQHQDGMAEKLIKVMADAFGLDHVPTLEAMFDFEDE